MTQQEKSYRILLVDDDEGHIEAMTDEINKNFQSSELVVFKTVREVAEKIDDYAMFDICIVDMMFESENLFEGGLNVLETLESHSPYAIRIVHTGKYTENDSKTTYIKKSFRKGAHEYFTKSDLKETMRQIKLLVQKHEKNEQQRMYYNQWINENEELLRQYEGRYIAIQDGQVVADGKNKLELNLKYDTWKDKQDVTEKEIDPFIIYYSDKGI